MMMTIFNNFKGQQTIKVPGKNPITLAQPKDSYTFEKLNEYIPYRKAILSRIASGHLTWKGKFPEDEQAPVHGSEQGEPASIGVQVRGKDAKPTAQDKPHLKPVPNETKEKPAAKASGKEAKGDAGEGKAPAKKAQTKKKTTKKAKSSGKKKTSKKASSKKSSSEQKPQAAPKGSLDQLQTILANKVDELKSTPREDMDKRTKLKKEMKAVKQQIAKLQAG